MIITQTGAQRLINNGNATENGLMYEASEDKTYAVITNHLKQRTDHVFVGYGDLREAA